MSSRFKNYGFWTALISCGFMLAQALGLKINAPYVNEIITAVLGLLVVLGIVNNPTDGKGFGDTKQPIEDELLKKENSDENRAN